MNILINLIKARWVFSKPKRKKILIYDRHSVDYSKYLFTKQDCEVFDARFESINFYVALLAMKSLRIRKFSDVYKKTFINLVAPKIVYTAIDNNPGFFKLKAISNAPTYISDQNGMSKVADSYKQKSFYGDLKKYKQKTNKMPEADHIFLFGKNDKERVSKVIKGNIHLFGNTKNNHFTIKKKKLKKKITSIMFISSGLFPSALKQDRIILRNLKKFCDKKNIQLSFCSRLGVDKETFHRRNFVKGDWIYLPKISTYKTYTNLNKQQMVVFSHSTLGFQALSKGLKCAVFYPCFPEKGAHGKFPKFGPFWSNSNNYSNFQKILNRVIGFSNSRWRKIAMKYAEAILSYNPTKTKKKEIINIASKL